MEYEVLPLFKSAYSFRSILNFNEKPEPDEAASIVDICRRNNLDKLFLVEDNMSSILRAKKACKDDIRLSFGLRITVCSDVKNDTIDGERSSHKIIIFSKDDDGYKILLKLFSLSATEFVYKGNPRIDYKHLEELWSNEHLLLAVPFYDSFIYNNLFGFGRCIPHFEFAKPVLFVEDNGLFFDQTLINHVYKYAKENKLNVIKSKSIYYENRSDFSAWQTYMCIQNRTSLRVPNQNHCSSNEFCFESWVHANAEHESYANEKPNLVPHFDKKNFKGVCFDFEAEDLNLFSAKAFQLSLIEFDARSIKQEHDHFLHWDQFNISKDAERITKFNYDDWAEVSEDAKEIFEKANDLFRKADIIVGHNIIGYDIHIYKNMCRALGLEPVDIENKLLDTFCFLKGMKLEIDYNKQEESRLGYQLRMYDYLPKEAKKRGFATLAALCDFFDVETDPNKLHNALYDVKCNVLAFQKMVKRIDL